MADTPTQLASPITVGELTDVPAPLSPIAAQFHQEVANRVVHRFATAATMNAWAAGDGSLAWCTELAAVFVRRTGLWWALTLQAGSDQLALGIIARAVGVYGQNVAAGTAATITNLSLTFTAEPARYYRTRYTVPVWLTGGSNPMARFAIHDNSGNRLTDSRFQVVAGPAQQPPITIEAIETGLSGSITRRAVCDASATGVVQLYFVGDSHASTLPFMTVEDLGNV